MKFRTIQGKTLDMGAILASHGHKRAVGNANMNARGDVLDKNGKVMTSRQQITTAYNQQLSNPVKQVSLRDISSEALSPAEAIKQNINAIPMTPQKRRKITDSD